MPDKKKRNFSDGFFNKKVDLNEVIIFDKPDLSKIRVELTWDGTDLDLGALLLGVDGTMADPEDLVFYNTERRRKTTIPFLDNPSFKPSDVFDGTTMTYDDDNAKKFYKNKRKFFKETLPLSADNAVIGSWDDITGESGEIIHILLDEVDTRKYKSIVIIAAVAPQKIKHGETFKDAKEPVLTIYDAEDEEVLAEYSLSDSHPNDDCVCIGKLKLSEDELNWEFEPLSNGYTGGIEYVATEIYY